MFYTFVEFIFLQVHLKKLEYHEKGDFFFHSFQKVKPMYYIDSLHIEWNIYLYFIYLLYIYFT